MGILAICDWYTLSGGETLRKQIEKNKLRKGAIRSPNKIRSREYIHALLYAGINNSVGNTTLTNVEEISDFTGCEVGLMN